MSWLKENLESYEQFKERYEKENSEKDKKEDIEITVRVNKIKNKSEQCTIRIYRQDVDFLSEFIKELNRNGIKTTKVQLIHLAIKNLMENKEMVIEQK